MSGEADNANATPVTIGLLWHSLAAGNLGVVALTVANRAIIAEVAAACGLSPRFVVMGMRESGAAPVDPLVEVFEFSRRSLLSPRGFWRVLGRVDCVIDIGAGDSFADIYGARRFAFLWLSKMMAIARGVPLMLAPQTIGPFTRRGYRWLAAMAMKRARAVIARDQSSLEAIAAIAPAAKRALAVDVAFRLPFESQAKLRGGARLRVGINASGLLFHSAETGRNRFGLSYDYAALTRALIAALVARGDVEVHLIAHATSAVDPTDDDGALADRLAVEFPQAIRVPNFATASAAKTYISGMDFLVAARMHACIAAFSSGVPVAPLAYSRKFAGLFDMVGYAGVLPVSGLDNAGALAQILAMIERRATLAEDIAQGMRRVEALLDVYRASLHDMFTDIASQKRLRA